MPDASRRTKPSNRESPLSVEIARKKSWQELAAEQGIKPISDPAKLIGKGKKLWASDEELDRFLEDIRKCRGEGE